MAHALSSGDNLVHSHVAGDGIQPRVLLRRMGPPARLCAQPRNLPVLNGFGGMDVWKDKEKTEPAKPAASGCSFDLLQLMPKFFTVLF